MTQDSGLCKLLPTPALVLVVSVFYFYFFVMPVGKGICDGCEISNEGERRARAQSFYLGSGIRRYSCDFLQNCICEFNELYTSWIEGNKFVHEFVYQTFVI